MCCLHFESVLLPANLVTNCSPILELKAKQEGRATTIAKNIYSIYNILSTKQVVCMYCREKTKISSFKKPVPFQFTAMCSHAQSAVSPFLAAEATSVR
jgi:hypothetical protein